MPIPADDKLGRYDRLTKRRPVDSLSDSYDEYAKTLGPHSTRNFNQVQAVIESERSKVEKLMGYPAQNLSKRKLKTPLDIIMRSSVGYGVAGTANHGKPINVYSDARPFHTEAHEVRHKLQPPSAFEEHVFSIESFPTDSREQIRAQGLHLRSEIDARIPELRAIAGSWDANDALRLLGFDGDSSAPVLDENLNNLRNVYRHLPESEKTKLKNHIVSQWKLLAQRNMPRRFIG